VTLYPLAFHMLLETKYGLWFHMPSAAEVENEGLVHLADPAITGSVDTGRPDDIAPPDGEGLPDGAVRPDAAGSLADAEAGMTATCGLAATCGIAGAPDALGRALAPAVARMEKPSSAAGFLGPCPLSRSVTAESAPAATRAHATTTPMSPRRDGGKTRRPRRSVPRVPASFSRPLVPLWRTRRSLGTAAPGSGRSYPLRPPSCP
jgi:hypothetical protein